MYSLKLFLVKTSSAVFVLSLALAPCASLSQTHAQPARLSALSRHQIVQVTIHADYKGSYDFLKESPTETDKAHAEFIVSQDYVEQLEWVGYQNTPGGFVPVPNSPKEMSGSFHYQSEDEGHNTALSDKHVINAAGNIEPIGTAGVEVGEKSSVIIIDADGKTLPTCTTTGNMNEDPKSCGELVKWGNNGIRLEDEKQAECNGTCAFLEFGYELHPESDRSNYAADESARASRGDRDFGSKIWFGSTTTGADGNYEIAFEGNRSSDADDRDEYVKKKHWQENLRVRVKITPVKGALSLNSNSVLQGIMSARLFDVLPVTDTNKNAPVRIGKIGA